MRAGATTKTEQIALPAVIERYLEVALFLLVLSGFGALASTGGLDAPSVALVGAAMLYRGYLLVQRRSMQIPERAVNWLTLGYVVFYGADYLLLSRSFLPATMHLVLFVMVLRLLSAHRDRDHYFLAVIAFLMVLSAAVLTVDSMFLLTFSAFMLTAVVTFILLEMKNSNTKATLRARPSGDEQEHRHMAISLTALSPILVVLMLAVAGAIFFVLPRISAGYLSAYAPGGDLATGFSEKVQLGRIGQIQQSNAVVMHIQIEGDTSGAHDLKWKGVALSYFDGRSWSNPFEQVLAQPLPDGRFAIDEPMQRAQPGVARPARMELQPLRYTVLMEPINTNIFFLAPRAYTLRGHYGLIAKDGGGAVYDLDAEHPVSRYEAASNVAVASEAELRSASASYNPQMEFTYLQFPALDQRIPALAEQIAAGADNNYDKAVAIERYLSTRFAYSLELPKTMPRDPLANFLFERKRGHCEYFASAMAIMLRTLHIPARVANGFRTGEFNDLSGQYVVRAANAHSWVEVYFPGYGWTSFDPTPSAPSETRSGWGRLMLYADAAASFWREWVVNYDAGHQRTLGQEVARNSRKWSDELRLWFYIRYERAMGIARKMQRSMSAAPGRWSVSGILITSGLVLLLSLRRIWRFVKRRRIGAHPERAPRAAATLWYERLMRLLARRGWKKSPAQTPAEFIRSIADDKLRVSVDRFTRHYEKARFGKSAADAARLPEVYEEISASKRG